MMVAGLLDDEQRRFLRQGFLPQTGVGPLLDEDGWIEPGDLFAAATNPQALLDAWSSLLADDRADGGEGSREVRRFANDPFSRLEQLHSSLQDGTWRPAAVRTFDLPEDGRTITMSTVADRVVERALAPVLAAAVDDTLSPFSFGFRRGLGVRDACCALAESLFAGWTHVVRTDIAAAFDSVPRLAVMQQLIARVPDRRALRVVELLLLRLDAAGLAGVGIPTGSSLSPLLLNLYLDPVDRWLLARGCTPIRFADDLAIPVAGPAAGESLISDLGSWLEVLGLSLNSEKTAVVSADHGVAFLGQRVRGLGESAPGSGYAHPRRVTVMVPAGGMARVSHRHLRVDRDGETLVTVNLARVRQVVLVGRVGVTTPLIAECAKAGVEICLVSSSGQFVARIGRARRGDVRIRKSQFAAAADAGRVLRLAADMVVGKLSNMRVAVLRARRGAGGVGATDKRVADTLEAAIKHAQQAESGAALMGLEGAATRAYFQWLADRLDGSWQFAGRNRRPPRDPVNAMLSFGYTLLFADTATAAELAHLDPELGFLHNPRWGRPSLALDLAEQWRPVIVDNVVMSLVDRGSVTPADFRDGGPDVGCRMNDKARRALLAAYERRMLTRTGATLGAGRRSMREWVWMSASALAEVLMDEPERRYRGFRWR
ncbi:MAG: CRISPR-associated endonuclease Cas1 [Candidatus Nanopelagicales bacterium]